MKFLLVAAIAALPFANQKCKSSQRSVNANCFKGRLEIKGICSNYTIRLLEGNIDTSKISATWMNEATNKAYTKVFALGSPCSFPNTINEGDEFYFTLDDSQQNCNVCMAYYPKPPKALRIKVLHKPCK